MVVEIGARMLEEILVNPQLNDTLPAEYLGYYGKSYKSKRCIWLVCLTCGKPRWIFNDAKSRRISHCRYCREYYIPLRHSIGNSPRICKVCGVTKPIEEFQFCPNKYHRVRTCSDCMSQYKWRWRKSNPGREYHTQRQEELRAKNLELYGTVYTREQRNLYNNRGWIRRMALRKNAIALYGGKCECCGELDPKRLTFDHINGDGRKDRINIDYTKAIAAGYPNNKYRLLCWNCNLAQGFYGYCPHNEKPDESSFDSAVRKARDIKRDMISAYGGKCAICGDTHFEFMTIDHINGGGCSLRRKGIIISGYRFYLWLRERNYPKDEYRLLCFSCNGSIGLRKRKEAES